MLGRDRAPRPPAPAALERRVRAHLAALTAAPSSVDPHSRPPLGAFLLAHRDWYLARTQAGPGRPAPALGTLVVVAVTLLGDIGTLFVSISVVLDAAPVAAAAIALALGVSAMFLAHQVGRWWQERRNGRGGMPRALAVASAVGWLGIGSVATLLRLAAPLNTAGGFGSGRSNAAAVAVVLASLLFVLYAGNGLAAATLGHRTAGDPRAGLWQLWTARRRARRERADACVRAWLRALDAQVALELAALHGCPMTTDSLTDPHSYQEVLR